ncbi:hypothetical protein GCM10022245_22310 [Streptomyces mayteni]
MTRTVPEASSTAHAVPGTSAASNASPAAASWGALKVRGCPGQQEGEAARPDSAAISRALPGPGLWPVVRS